MGRSESVYAAALLCSLGWQGLFCHVAIGADPAANVESIRIELRLDDTNLGDTDVKADFGLGFPFRLDESATAEKSPFETDGSIAVRPVEITQRQEAGQIFIDATFRKADTNSKDPQTNDHVLLDEVRVGDLAYVGLVASEADFVVRSLRVWVNDQMAYEETDTERDSRAARVRATDQAGNAKEELGSALSKISDLEAFEAAGLASDSELQSLLNLRQQVDSLRRLLERSEGVISGTLPFFTADLTTGPPRSETAVTTGTVTFITADHVNAETEAPAFLRIGGKKFLIDPLSDSSDATEVMVHNASTGMMGFQRFDLNLVRTPLVAADLRSFAVGLLGAVNVPSGVPDRWHLERMVVELDQRVVFDSDESEVDRKSLEAIRIVPPTLVAVDGDRITTPMTDRECSLWIAGRGQGLDLIGGGPLPLPAPDSSDFPSPEPVSPDRFGSGGAAEQDPLSPMVPPSGGMPLFPGEQAMPGWSDGGAGTGAPNDPSGDSSGFAPWPKSSGDPSPGNTDPSGDAAGNPQNWGPWPGGTSNPGGAAPGGYPPGHWLGQFFDRLMTWVLGKSSPLAPGVDPPPFADPFALDEVRLTRGWRSDESMRVQWDTKGSAQAIDRYEVSLIAVHPESQKQVFGPEVYAQTTVPRIKNEIDLTLDAGSTKPPSGVFFVAPKVVAVPVDAKQTPHERMGPARLVFPVGSKPLEQLSLVPKYLVREAGPTGTAWYGSVDLESPDEPARPHVWLAGHPDSHNAILFADPRPGMHVVVRPGTPPTREIGVTFTKNHFTGKADLVGHVGFLGRGSNSNETTVHVFCSLRGQISNQQHHFPPQSIQLSDAGSGEPAAMQPIRCSLDTTQAKFNNESVDLIVVLLVQTERTDTNHPVALIGMALEPQP